MVDLNFCGRRLGTVAIFATLFVAIQVNGENGCVFDFEKENSPSDIDLECNGLKNSWSLKDASEGKKAFVVEPEEEGCLKTKIPVTLNSTTRVVIKIGKNGIGEDSKVAVRLVPIEGTCPDEECYWVLKDVPETKSDGWLTLEHKFPLKVNRDCNIQLEVGKGKGRFELNSIAIPNPSGTGKCNRNFKTAEVEDHVALRGRFVNRDLRDEVGASSSESTTGHATGGGSSTTPKGKTSGAPAVVEISKNLILASASVLILNHIFN